ncbi:hypothetical protein BDA96_01G334700 [Sorghum bicolor]|uniref:Knottin scorpion toxin-like domain-containing protein n=1 Tax=Sorghum bicolor TaxID=4558 RepID=A0A921S2P7_SORBI|nr:hypothetical protein BDA96_01G334700 [Sorghum bicolor]
MEPSREKLSAAVVLLLTLLVMVAGTDASGSGTRLPDAEHPVTGALCVRSDYCAIGCREEGKGYTGGKCLISPTPLDGIRCYCVKPCDSTH